MGRSGETTAAGVGALRPLRKLRPGEGLRLELLRMLLGAALVAGDFFLCRNKAIDGMLE